MSILSWDRLVLLTKAGFPYTALAYEETMTIFFEVSGDYIVKSEFQQYKCLSTKLANEWWGSGTYTPLRKLQ